MASSDLTVLCFLWAGEGRHEALYTYSARYVNTLQRMLARNLSAPHELVCCTNMPDGVECRTVPLPDEALARGALNPKLYAFHPDGVRLFGPRILMLDLDVVIVRPFDDLITDEPFVAWSVMPRTPGRFNTSFVLMDAGAYPEVWETYDPETAPALLEAAGMDCWDQGWVSYCLGDRGRGIPRTGAGLESFKPQIGWSLPDEARLVFFNGPRSPEMPELQRRHPWIAENWK